MESEPCGISFPAVSEEPLERVRRITIANPVRFPLRIEIAELAGKRFEPLSQLMTW